MHLKIGELAKRAGLSVRALHHYDAIDLLSPSVRTPGGARLYGPSDLVRLHRIQALKQMGYALPEIRTALNDTPLNPLDIIRRQASALETQARRAQTLAEKLRALAEQIAAGIEGESADWLDLLEMMTIYERHLTEDELHALQSPGQDSAQALTAPWRKLVAEVDAAMRRQMTPDCQQAHVLAWRWVRLVIAMTNNDAALAGKLKSLQEQELRAQEILGITPAMFAWIGLAITHARIALFAKHLSARQLAEVRKRQQATMAHMDAWPLLVARVRDHLSAGVPSQAKPMQELARCWEQLFRDAYCGNNRALETKVRRAFAMEPELSLGVGVDPALMAYIHAAIQHQKETQ
ncbi:MAG: MerR family transcriptional regulator [Pseudomonadota bacterium]